MCPFVRDAIRAHSFPLDPRPTDWEPVIAQLDGIKAVLFDMYGTLFVSGADNADTPLRGVAAPAFADALRCVGLRLHCLPAEGLERFRSAIKARHAEMRSRGNDYPEIDIVEIWDVTLCSLMQEGAVDARPIEEDLLRRLAIEYEWRTNPVWPMPHAAWCMAALRSCDVKIGLISNAQFFTPELFPALLERTLEELGVDPDLQFYSYRYGCAKPGTGMHLAARRALARANIKADETLCVGNDMLKDIVPAAKLGFRTALFAGDQRSLRWSYCLEWADVAPNLVITDLAQLPPCVTVPRRQQRRKPPLHRLPGRNFTNRPQYYG